MGRLPTPLPFIWPGGLVCDATPLENHLPVEGDLRPNGRSYEEGDSGGDLPQLLGAGRAKLRRRDSLVTY
ncbi:MAG: hypothetical protein ACYDBP_15495 [Leptospirales bacterium]